MSQRIGIVGPGRLGRQLAYWLARGGRAPVAVFGRSPESASLAADLVAVADGQRPAVCESLADLAEQCDIILLTVPDRILPELAAELCKAPVHGLCIAHSCGALPAAVLDPVTAGGASPATFHPIQSFPPLSLKDVAEQPDTGPFLGIAIGIEAEEEWLGPLSGLARALSAVPLRLSGDPASRALYHAAAVVASNAMVGLLDFGIELMVRAGIEEDAARIALLPLMGGTLANLIHHMPGAALTGPVARGDAGTVEAHLAAMAGTPALQALYSNLTARLLVLAVKSGRIDADQANDISQVLLKRLLGK